MPSLTSTNLLIIYIKCGHVINKLHPLQSNMCYISHCKQHFHLLCNNISLVANTSVFHNTPLLHFRHSDSMHIDPSRQCNTNKYSQKERQSLTEFNKLHNPSSTVSNRRKKHKNFINTSTTRINVKHQYKYVSSRNNTM